MNALTEVMAERVVELEKQNKELLLLLKQCEPEIRRISGTLQLYHRIVFVLANAKEATK